MVYSKIRKIVNLAAKNVKRQLTASPLSRNFKRVCLEYFFLLVLLKLRMQGGSDRLEKITGCVKHVPFPAKLLIWSEKIRDFHKKIEKSRISNSARIFLEKIAVFRPPI